MSFPRPCLFFCITNIFMIILCSISSHWSYNDLLDTLHVPFFPLQFMLQTLARFTFFPAILSHMHFPHFFLLAFMFAHSLFAHPTVFVHLDFNMTDNLFWSHFPGASTVGWLTLDLFIFSFLRPLYFFISIWPLSVFKHLYFCLPMRLLVSKESTHGFWLL